MSEDESKPEWFHMADADWASNPQAINTKEVNARRKNPIRLMAISTPLLVLGVGLFFAQTQQAPDAFAAATTTIASTPFASPTTSSSTPSQSSVTAESTPVTTHQAPLVSTPKVATTSTSNPLATLQNGLKLPAKGSIQSSDESGSDDGEGQDN